MTAFPPSALRRATLVPLLAALIWGSMIPVLGTLAQHYDKWLLSWLRYLLGMPVLWLAVLMRSRLPPSRSRCGLASSGSLVLR